MRVLLAGAGGVVGQALLPRLIARGHEVCGLVRSSSGVARVAALGAKPIQADALDPDAVRSAFAFARPDAVVHQLTALEPEADLRRFDRAFAATNALRIRGTDILVAAAREVGVRRFVAQSFCGWTWEQTGGSVKSEDDPLDPDPPTELRATLDAICHVERAMAEAVDLHGVALRYGAFYGPGTGLSTGGMVVEAVRRRRLPIVAGGGGIWSFVHVDDVAAATVCALEGKGTGIFNVVDDDPAAVRDWLPALARAIDARPPLRLPRLVARAILPRHLMLMMTQARGASNARFKVAFDWQPRWTTWRDGFCQALEATGEGRRDGAGRTRKDGA